MPRSGSPTEENPGKQTAEEYDQEQAGVAGAGRTAAAGHSGRRRPGGFWPGRAGRHGVGDARLAAKAAGLVAPGHGARSRRSAKARRKASASALAWAVRHGGGPAGERVYRWPAGPGSGGRITALDRKTGGARARQRWRGSPRRHYRDGAHCNGDKLPPKLDFSVAICHH